MGGSGTGTAVSTSGTGGSGLVTAPSIEPITLAQAKMQLVLESGTLSDNTTLYASIAAGSHALNVGYVLLGTAIDVLGHNAVVFLQPVDNGAGGTVDVKIQEADASAGPWTDWTGGAFTQVTESNDTVIQEKQYTGTKQWIRTAANILVAACEFGTSILVWEPTSTEDDLLNDDIVAARVHVEDITRRALLTQTWDYCPKAFPAGNTIKLPHGNLQAVTFIKYKKSDWASSADDVTLVEGTDYIVETNGDQCGKIVLPYGASWPSFTPYPSNPITIRYTCGWTTRALIPGTIRKAVKMLCAKFYKSRGDDFTGVTMIEDDKYMRLLASSRLWDEF